MTKSLSASRQAEVIRSASLGSSVLKPPNGLLRCRTAAWINEKFIVISFPFNPKRYRPRLEQNSLQLACGRKLELWKGSGLGRRVDSAVIDLRCGYRAMSQRSLDDENVYTGFTCQEFSPKEIVPLRSLSSPPGEEIFSRCCVDVQRNPCRSLRQSPTRRGIHDRAHYAPWILRRCLWRFLPRSPG